jgi:hypothetical protein
MENFVRSFNAQILKYKHFNFVEPHILFYFTQETLYEAHTSLSQTLRM